MNLQTTAGIDRSAAERAVSMPDLAVEIRGLHKTYKAKGGSKLRALDSVDLSIPRGSFYGLLGPNGAGKSTLINIMAGLVNKSSGVVRIWGHDIDSEPRLARAAIGVVPQELNIDPFFKPYDLLEIQAGLYGVPPAERQTAQILERMRLSDKAKAYARTLSGGMRRRLMVAKAMVHRPPILVLDEPTAGVDIELRRQLWEEARRLNRQGVTILLTTHYLEEAEELCDRIAIINHGWVIADDTKPALMARLENKELRIRFAKPVPETLSERLAAFEPERPDAHHLVFRYRPSASPVAQVLAAVSAAGLEIVDVSTVETDLEDVFLQLTEGAHD